MKYHFSAQSARRLLALIATFVLVAACSRSSSEGTNTNWSCGVDHDCLDAGENAKCVAHECVAAGSGGAQGSGGKPSIGAGGEAEADAAVPDAAVPEVTVPCEPLDCSDAGACPGISLPLQSEGMCNQTAIDQGYAPPTVQIGCGYISRLDAGRYGAFTQVIYDQTTGALVGIRSINQYTLAFTCKDSRPEVLAHPVRWEPWRPTDCSSVMSCYLCWIGTPTTDLVCM